MKEEERELIDAYRELVKLQLDDIMNLEEMMYLYYFIKHKKKAED